MRLDASKICFITNVSQEEQYENCVSYIKKLNIPYGMTVEFRTIYDAKSMCEGYARAQRSSDAKYKIYLHQDVMITDKNFLNMLVSTFRSDASYGIAGLIGAYSLPQSAIWWENSDDNQVGITIDTAYSDDGVPYRRKLQYTSSTFPIEVAALDGLLLATQYDLPWRSDIFHDFHFYDISQCFEFRRKGLKAIVLPLTKPVCEHWNEHGTARAPYYAERSKFVSEYSSDIWSVRPFRMSVILLPLSVSKELFFQIGQIKQQFDPQQCELIVASPRPTDELRAKLKEVSVRSIFSESNLSMAECINKAIKASTGEKILILEDSCIFAPFSFQSMLATLPHDIPSIVGPLANLGQFTSLLQALKNSASYSYHDYDSYCAFAKDWAAGIYGKHSIQKTLLIDAGATLLNRKAIEAAGLFDTDFKNDLNRMVWDYCLRIYQRHGVVFLAEDSCIHRKANNARLPEDEITWKKKWGIPSIDLCHSRIDPIKYIDFSKNPSTVLEAGCACGLNFIKIKNHVPDIECTGIELNKHSAAIAKLFANVYAMDLENFERPEWHDKFDIIVMGDILEHLKDPWQAVRNMFRLQSPGGEILISVPNIMHFSIFNQMFHGYWEYEDAGILDRTHLRFFTKKTAQRLLEQAGYQIRSINPIQWFSKRERQVQEFINKLRPLLSNEVEIEQILSEQWVIVGEKPEEK